MLSPACAVASYFGSVQFSDEELSESSYGSRRISKRCCRPPADFLDTVNSSPNRVTAIWTSNRKLIPVQDPDSFPHITQCNRITNCDILTVKKDGKDGAL